jgi:hypothetical protein
LRTFGKLESSFWRNPKTKRLDDQSKLLLTYLFSCQHGNSIGCFVLPLGYISADLGWPTERVSELVSELVRKGFIERDEETELTRIVGWFGHNYIENSNVAKGVIKTLGTLPRGPVFTNLLKALNELQNEFLTTLLIEYRNKLANEFPTPEPEPETKPEPDKDAAKAAPLAFSGKVIKLKNQDLATWKKSYCHIPNLEGVLHSRDDWLAHDAPPDTRKSWFVSTSNYLAKFDRECAAKPSKPGAEKPYMPPAVGTDEWKAQNAKWGI